MAHNPSGSFALVWAKSTPRQCSEYAALLSGKSQTEAARAIGVDPSTLKRWLRLPEFQAEYLQVRRETMSQASARMQNNAVGLTSLELKLVSQETTPASIREHLILGLLDRVTRPWNARTS